MGNRLQPRVQNSCFRTCFDNWRVISKSPSQPSVIRSLIPRAVRRETLGTRLSEQRVDNTISSSNEVLSSFVICAQMKYNPSMQMTVMSWTLGLTRLRAIFRARYEVSAAIVFFVFLGSSPFQHSASQLLSWLRIHKVRFFLFIFI